MSYISAFEQNTRCSLAISMLNKFRRWILGRDKSLSPNNAEIIEKAISAINGNFEPDTAMIYYFKDSGDTENTIVFQLFNVLQDVLKDEADREKFLQLVWNLLDSRRPDLLSKKDIRLVKRILENAINFIDSELNPVEPEKVYQATHELDIKGF